MRKLWMCRKRCVQDYILHLAEGTQRQHSLLLLVWHFRIALQLMLLATANRLYCADGMVRHYFRYRSTVLLNIGEPINVTGCAFMRLEMLNR